LKIDRLNIRKMIAIAGVGILVVSLIPMLWVSIYNHPTGDDIFYGLEAHQAWEKTGSVLSAIIAAIQGVASDYYRWQGTFVALFFMRLQPTVFGEGLYSLTPFLVIGLLLGGLFYAVRSLAKHILPMDKWDILSVWAILSFVMLQWVQVVGDAFYWFNGALYYGGFFGLMLFGVGVAMEYYFAGKKRHLVMLLLLSIMVGGGNYISLLVSLIILTLTSGYLLWKKSDRRWGFVSAEVLLAGCFIISAIAPGNAVRQGTRAPMQPLEAIWNSVLQGFAYVETWGTGWWMLGILALLPTMVAIIKKSGCKFRLPGLVLAFLYGLFCAMQCPTMYAEGTTGPGRVVNVIWYGFILLSYVAVFYLLGWICNTAKEIWLIDKGRLYLVWMFVCAVFLVVQVGIGWKNGSIKNMTTLKAVSDITSGRAKAYDLEYGQRIAILHDTSIEEVVFEEYRNKPKTVYVGDYSPDASEGANIHLAKWYRKQNVRVNYAVAE